MAKKTVADCIGEARTILQDKNTPYRYEEQELLDLFNNAQNEVKRLRPDAWAGLYSIEQPIYTLDNYDTESFPFDSIFFQSVVLFIVGMAELRDDEFTMDNRAGILLKAFSSQLTTTGGM